MTADAATGQRLSAALALAERERRALVDTHQRLFPAGRPVQADWLMGIDRRYFP